MRINKWIYFIIFLLPAFLLKAQEKRALIIAIGNYPESSGWAKISSNNDSPILTETLKRQHFSDIEVLSDSKATKSEIIKALNRLVEKTKPGDVLFLHFSSHGQQIEDMSGDESDGLDEAIVCYGAPKNPIPGYKGEEHLLDDELGDWIFKLREKSGKKGDVILLADACYSGSISRGSQTIRGGGSPLSLSGKKVGPSAEDDGISPADSEESETPTDLAPFLTISASGPNEPNYECLGKDFKSYGSLSYAFSLVMGKINEHETYRSLFGKLQLTMKLLVKNQNPEMEGLPDRELFGGKKVGAEAYVEIRNISRNSFEIPVGQFHEVHTGSKIELFPLGIYKEEGSKAIATGIVKESGLFNSTVQTQEAVKPGNYWAFIAERSFGDIRIGVDLFLLQDTALAGSIKRVLETSKIVNLDAQNPELAIVTDSLKASELRLISRQTGEYLGGSIGIAHNGSHGIRIKNKIETHSKARFLLNFNPYSEGLEAYLEILPATGYRPQDTISLNRFIKNGSIALDTSQKVFLKVVSESNERIYFNIVDIDPEGNIAVLVPAPEDFDGKEYFVDSGKSFILPRKNINGTFNILNINPPFGSETVKLIISDRPMDLRKLATERNGSRGKTEELSSLEKVFDLAGTLGTRGLENESFSSQTKASVYNLNFRIIP